MPCVDLVWRHGSFALCVCERGQEKRKSKMRHNDSRLGEVVGFEKLSLKFIINVK